MIKTAAVSLLCGLLGAALYGRFVPPAAPTDYIAVVSYTGANGKELSDPQIKLVHARAEAMAKAGYMILNESALYKYPAYMQIPQTVSSSAN